MNFEEYFSYDALGLAELVRTNQISESELLEVTIEICNQIDPKINAVPIKHFELARKEAKSFKNNQEQFQSDEKKLKLSFSN